ncbi:MAG: hypothetical protein CVT88_04405 [Candidatus Altiarchaeales archaeon HGW-Altiarchaeales-1]|nr:MAG: hypothetical protein CVT88_04405 [Candidatus Altiarchaeales archaeon HGW-Altiarchaeales-1]
MEKNIYLTRSEQKVYNLIGKVRGSIIKADNIKQLFSDISEEKINKVCSSLSKKGHLYRIKRNIYLIQSEPSEKPLILNPYKLALQIYPGYLAFHSALRIYDLTEYEPFTIFIATAGKSCMIKTGEYIFKYIFTKNTEGVEFYKNVYVSSKTKTFYDCFSKPQYCGGYSAITKALYLNKGCDWDKLKEYFENFASDTLCQRSGYVLELIKKANIVEIPDFIISYFKSRLKTTARLIPQNKSAGKYIKEWRILDNLGSENIISI